MLPDGKLIDFGDKAATWDGQSCDHHGFEGETFGIIFYGANGSLVIAGNAAMIADSDRWFRDSSQAIEAHRDGPTLDAAGLPFFTLLFARAFSVWPETSHQGWLKQTREVQVPTAPLVGLITVRDRNDRGDAIAAGRAWQRLHLNATAHGMAM